MAPPSLQPRPPIYIKSLLSTWPSDLKHHLKFVQEIFFTDRRVLFLLDDLSLKSSHSIFFNTLKSRGFDLDFKLADDSKLALQRYGQYLYDGLIIFAPSSERFGGSLDSKPIADFVDSGRNLILSADTSASDMIRGIATECRVDFDEDSSAMVIDHTSFPVSDAKGDHTLIDAEDLVISDVIL